MKEQHIKRCVGYGSLVSLASAQRSAPSLTDFGLYSLKGYKRVFGKVNPHCIFDGRANSFEKNISSCFVVPCETNKDTQAMVVCSFQLTNHDEWKAIQIRECDYYMDNVDILSLDGKTSEKATVFCGYDNDNHMLRQTQKSFDDIYNDLHPDFLKLYPHPIYRDDVLPSIPYLRLCMKAYFDAGFIDNFVETSFLADRKTPLAHYLNDIKWDKDDPESWR